MKENIYQIGGMSQCLFSYSHTSSPPPTYLPSPPTKSPPTSPLHLCPAHWQHRYVVFQVEVKHSCVRRFNSQGNEVEANFGQTGVVRTGYLHSSYSKSLFFHLFSWYIVVVIIVIIIIIIIIYGYDCQMQGIYFRYS